MRLAGSDDELAQSDDNDVLVDPTDSSDNGERNIQPATDNVLSMFCSDVGSVDPILLSGTSGPSPRILAIEGQPTELDTVGNDPNARGNYVVFVEEDRARLKIVELDSGQTVATRTFEGMVESPSISESGETVVFVRITEAGSAIVRWQPLVDQVSVLHDPSGRVSSPAISNDGRLIAWVEGSSTGEEIYVGEVGSGRIVSTANWTGIDPSWSPDGKAVAFSGPFNDGRAIFVRSLESGSEKRVSHPADAADSSPAWSPTCVIAFIRSTGASASIWTVDDQGEKGIGSIGAVTNVSYGWL